MTPETDRPASATPHLPASAPPPCPRCLTPALLVARYPHSWHNRSGTRVDGLRESVLCRSCDAEDPAADGLLAHLAGVGTEADTDAGTTADTAADADADRPAPPAPGAFTAHLETWLAAVRQRTPDRAGLDAEEARWRAGEL
ncbi:DUF6300 family protein [Streptomyces sp. NPDC057555]|uniref:DUF6300 family protein n=1 Tax=Streptomyces sp. NPDC057555 TaxID=3346166 RepID=UPI0036B5EE69